MNFINIHTHSINKATESISVVNVSCDSYILDNNYYSVGIHPWNISKINAEQELIKLVAIAENKNILAIGECGLDKLIEVDFKEQEKIFASQVELAQKINKPLIIHCVKAFDDLIRIKSQVKVSVPMIIHGYNNNVQIAEQLVKHEFYFSFGKALLNNESNASKVISIIPTQKLFLETDDKDVSIKSIFEAAAMHLRMDVKDLKKNIYFNFKNVFNSPLEKA